MSRQTRRYAPAERAQAVALAAAIGPVRASEHLGIPRRTVSQWMHVPAASPIIAAAEQDIATMLRTAHTEALKAVMADIHNPRARLGDKASALRVLGEQLALAEGRATSRNLNIDVTVDPFTPYVEGLSPAEFDQLTSWLDGLEHADPADVPELAAQVRTALLAAGQEDGPDG